MRLCHDDELPTSELEDSLLELLVSLEDEEEDSELLVSLELLLSLDEEDSELEEDSLLELLSSLENEDSELLSLEENSLLELLSLEEDEDSELLSLLSLEEKLLSEEGALLLELDNCWNFAMQIV